MIVIGIELENFWELLLLGLEADMEEVDLARVEVLAAGADLSLKSLWVYF